LTAKIDSFSAFKFLLENSFSLLLQIVLVNVLYQNLDDNAFIALDLKKYSRTLAIIREINTKILSDSLNALSSGYEIIY
jgi:hypothetical protein